MSKNSDYLKIDISFLNFLYNAKFTLEQLLSILALFSRYICLFFLAI